MDAWRGLPLQMHRLDSALLKLDLLPSCIHDDSVVRVFALCTKTVYYRWCGGFLDDPLL